MTSTRDMKEGSLPRSLLITVRGLVQGVGFRPFVYRIAKSYGLTGWVMNTNENVRIIVTGMPGSIGHFLVSLREEAPPASVIEEISFEETDFEPFSAFEILRSDDVSNDITEISPDIAVCNECLEDMEKTGNRQDYAFVNCTRCGPRFTIIEDLPYDRGKTTMRSFAMCPECRKEYDAVTDRRFHAQPTACTKCGPQYEMITGNKRINDTIGEIIAATAQLIDTGKVVLIKGLGGMHLACDALSGTAVEKIRNIKNREGKPLAVMFRDESAVKEYAAVGLEETRSLTSWRRPIVLLEEKERSTGPFLAGNVSSGLDLIGAMLPYMPFHYLLFRKLKTDAIVLTSGNLGSEPILTSNQETIEHFSDRVDAMILHNRKIHNRTDDSVVRVISGRERVFRRSRGYVPAPVRMRTDTNGIIAFGAELTNCFCAGKGRKAFLSQHIGDLRDYKTTSFYEETLQRFIRLFRVTPSLLAVDMHPDYHATRVGLAFGDLPVVFVQHHHAHIASCMAEHGLDEQVIGVAFDGTGYGEDGNIWGSEFMVCDLNNYRRISHFEYLPLPGGDMAAEEPWRMAVSWLFREIEEGNLPVDPQTGIEGEILKIVPWAGQEKIRLMIHMIRSNINCPLTSGAGRLFDAVASILGLCQVATFPAEGPMKLESIVAKNCRGSYPFTAGNAIGFGGTIKGIIEDIERGTEKKEIAAKFHNTVISAIFETVRKIREKEGIGKVVLSGGVFQNRYLSEGVTDRLEKYGFQVYTQQSVPANDGGIALGQLAIAAKRRELGCV